MKTLIENLEFILTVDEHDTVLNSASVILDGDKIIDIGPSAEVAERHDISAVDAVIDGTRMGMCPGFVDAHTHLGETLQRGAFRDTLCSKSWIDNFSIPWMLSLSDEDKSLSPMIGCAELIRHGTTCVLDMGDYGPEISVRAIEDAGMRGLTGQQVSNLLPPNTNLEDLPDHVREQMFEQMFFATDLASGLEKMDEAIQTWNGAADGRVRCGVTIHGKETNTLDMLVAARELAEKRGVLATYHLCTTEAEVERVVAKHGKRQVERIADAGGLGPNLVISHGIALKDFEVPMLAKADTKVCFMPGVALKFGKGLTVMGKHPEMLDAGMTLCLGSDAVEATGNHSMIRTMYLAAGIYKDARIDETLIGAHKALRMATIDGAKSLMWDDEIGSIEIGKKADFVLFNLNHVEWAAYGDPVLNLVWGASSASIAETWANGQALFRDGKLQTFDEDALYAAVRDRAAAIRKRAPLGQLPEVYMPEMMAKLYA